MPLDGPARPHPKGGRVGDVAKPEKPEPKKPTPKKPKQKGRSR